MKLHAPMMEGLKDSLLAIVGPLGLLSPEDFEGRSCDPFMPVAIGSPFIVRPSNAAEISQIIGVCKHHKFGIVTHGGRTGVCGATYAGPDTIVISLERMTRIEEICDMDQIAVVQAGVTIEALQAAVMERGLFYPIDLGAKGSATLGGTIATNAGGNHVLRWGMTRQNVLGMEAVLADGTIVSAMNRLLKNNTGYDLKQILIGSEGTLGIVTRAVVKLVPLPTSRDVAFVGVDSMEQVIALLALARKLASLSAFEVLWSDYYELVAASNSGRQPLAPGRPYYILIESMGYDEAIDTAQFEHFIDAGVALGLIADGVFAGSERQRQELWRVREASKVFVKEFGQFVSFDVGVPLRDVEQFVDDAYAALRDRFPQTRGVTFGHLGDNNIHLGISIGRDTREHTVEVERIVFDILQRFGGALTAEHGVGQFKREFLEAHKSVGEMIMMRRVRQALDPDRRLNPEVLFHS
jgi:FAD/FMN-containing dehydrogenase